jgi:GNAT superfamily N-acetyltransferase
MRTKTIVKPFEKVTKDEYAKVYRLNFRENGLMQEDLRYLRRRVKQELEPTGAKVIMIKDEDENILSWSLVQPHATQKISAQFYTRASARRKGYGSRVMKQVLKIDDNPHIYPHNDVALGFFKKYNDKVEHTPYYGTKLK